MGFWILMLVMDLLCPIAMIAIGKAFLNAAPKEINPIFGYRTKRSMINRDTWEFAHKHCGRLWLRIGLLLLPLSVIPLLFVIQKSHDLIGSVGATVCLLQVLVLILSIFPTEFALKQAFDINGNKKDG